MTESAPRARTKRWSGPLPEPVMEALDRLAQLGEPDMARAALLALKPPKKRGGPAALTPEEAISIQAAFRRHWRADPALTVHEVSKLISKASGGTVSPRSVRRRLERFCFQTGTTVAEWEGRVRAQEAARPR